jgi:hypothetical protein
MLAKCNFYKVLFICFLRLSLICFGGALAIHCITVISPLLANIFLHIVFDKWMDKHHPEKPFERYADDIVVHCKSEKQAEFVMRVIKERMQSCKLEVHNEKSKIVNLRGHSATKYPKGFDFLGFTIRPRPYKSKSTGVVKSIPCICVSQKS